MGETMKTLPELFAEVKAKNNDFCHDEGLWRNTSRQEWWLCGHEIPSDLASTIIVGACIQWLTKNAKCRASDITHFNADVVVWDGVTYLGEQHATASLGESLRSYESEVHLMGKAPTLAQALLLAVLAQHERSGT